MPICPSCGTHEAIGPDYLYSAACWPVDSFSSDHRQMYADAGITVTPGMVTAGTGEPLVLSESGVSKLVDRQHPGGWVEFGCDCGGQWPGPEVPPEV